MIGTILTLLSGVVSSSGGFAIGWLFKKASIVLSISITLSLVDYVLSRAMIGFIGSFVMPVIPPAAGCAFVTLQVQPCLSAIAAAWTFRVTYRLIVLPIITKAV